MYPHGELTRLLDRKAELRRRIAVSRLACMIDAAEVTRPLAWLDQVAATWRGMRPLVRLAAVPLGLWLLRSFRRRFRVVSTVLRWGPLVLGALRGVTRFAGGPVESRPAA